MISNGSYFKIIFYLIILTPLCHLKMVCFSLEVHMKVKLNATYGVLMDFFY